MSHPNEYSINVSWAGNVETQTEVWIAEIPEFGAAARVHGGTRLQAIDLAEIALDALILAYQGQGLALPAAEGEGI
jgi:predicted RNase H-like HicB family nuclease